MCRGVRYISFKVGNPSDQESLDDNNNKRNVDGEVEGTRGVMNVKSKRKVVQLMMLCRVG